MARIPKWLLLKEWLTFDDVEKVMDSAPSSIENVFAQDCSVEFSRIFIFNCTFCPNLCHKQFKEYRFETTARERIRVHIKDHINDLKCNSSDNEKNKFCTRNQLFKGSKSVTQKRKATADTDIPGRKTKKTKKSELDRVFITDATKNKTPKASRHQIFTKLRQTAKSHSLPETRQEIIEHEMDGNNGDPVITEDDVALQDNDDNSSDVNTDLNLEVKDCDDSKPDIFSSEETDGEKISCETQTEQSGKEQETFLYKVATKMFAADRAQWKNIEQVLHDILSKESSSEELTSEERERILAAMKQWIDSVKIYDRLLKERVSEPLTQRERDTLDGLSIEDWKRLEMASDPESKLRLTVYARLLLRDYECRPRKLKPKNCKHCGMQYTASTSLFTHLVSLSGIRFWVCRKCSDSNKADATFTRKHSLQYHILKEIGIPRYRCMQPGCSKTHNHTHHQKSHARQHTGEKHYTCSVDGCTGRFSNRNTYGRHLLQFHSIELTRNNQLQPIDVEEANKKVFDARLRARERSKCKRQGADRNNKVLKPFQTSKKLAEPRPKKLTIDENILTAAQHFLKEVKLEEGATDDNTHKKKNSLENYLQPTASQLLSGIARDVQNTSSSLQDAKSSESMMGGLNLLATVSNYMTVESCINVERVTKNDTDDIKFLDKQEFHSDKATELMKQAMKVQKTNEAQDSSSSNQFDVSTSGIEMLRIKGGFIQNHNAGEYKSCCQIVKLSDISELSKTGKKLTGIFKKTTYFPSGFECDKYCHSTSVTSDADNKRGQNEEHTALDMKLASVENLKQLTFPVSPPDVPSEHHCIQSSICHLIKTTNSVSANSNNSKDLLIQSVRISPNSYLIPRVISSHLDKTQGAIIPTALTVLSSSSNSNGNNVDLSSPSSPAVKSNLFNIHGTAHTAKSRTSESMASVPISPKTMTHTSNSSDTSKHVSLSDKVHLTHILMKSSVENDSCSLSVPATKLPLATVIPNVNKGNVLPGRIIDVPLHTQLSAGNKINIVSSLPNSLNKNIQVLKVTDTPAELQLRSVSCTSGRKYIVITPASQRANHIATSSSSDWTNKTLPFTEL